MHTRLRYSWPPLAISALPLTFTLDSRVEMSLDLACGDKVKTPPLTLALTLTLNPSRLEFPLLPFELHF